MHSPTTSPYGYSSFPKEESCRLVLRICGRYRRLEGTAFAHRPADFIRVELDARNPVSYTHLDVYKRQIPQRAHKRHDSRKQQHADGNKQPKQHGFGFSPNNGGFCNPDKTVILFIASPPRLVVFLLACAV